MIELHHITKSYRTPMGTNVVLNDISAVFPAHESVGVLGRNGAGKSTLLRIIGGAEMPDSGEVIRKGRVSWPIGFGGGFNGSLTGEENCRFVARIYSQDVDEIVDATREFAEIGKYFYNPVRTYSSGMRARLAFGVSMAIDFDVYLIDEITAVGDAAFRTKCQAVFNARQEHSNLIMVSHAMETIRQYCTRAAIVSNAGIEFYDSVDEAIDRHEAAMAA